MAALDDDAAVARSQVSFIDYVVQPLFSVASKVFPEAKELEENAKRNRGAWEGLAAKS